MNNPKSKPLVKNTPTDYEAISLAHRSNRLLKRRERATGLEDHVIVCGMGTLGYEVVQGLHQQGQPTTWQTSKPP